MKRLGVKAEQLSVSKKVKSEHTPKSHNAVQFAGFAVVNNKPRRKNGVFTFDPTKEASETEIEAISKFHPNKSPSEVLRDGAFGGTYFRVIKSGVCKKTFSNAWKELPQEWIEGLDPHIYLCRPWKDYDKRINKYGVKAGTTLEAWESSGWISPIDPFGWFQWYCRFFQGRRTGDDERQIDRWLKCCGEKGRWKANLCGKVVLAGSTFDDAQVSPVVRQTLLHWAYELTEADFNTAKGRFKKGKGAYFVNQDKLKSAVKSK